MPGYFPPGEYLSNTGLKKQMKKQMKNLKKIKKQMKNEKA